MEDNAIDATLTTRSLRGFNATVSIIKDGFQAIVYLQGLTDRTTLPALILLDLSLPGIHGLDVLRKIRSNDCTNHVKFVILTGNHEEKSAMDCYMLKSDGVLVKPLTSETIEGTHSQFGIIKEV